MRAELFATLWLKDQVLFTTINKGFFFPSFYQVEYAVGLIMQHKKYHYRCVIAGWDSTCEASEQWIHQMGVDRLPLGRHQPFYHVWASDGSDRYAAQENLMIAPTPGPVVGYAYLTFKDTVRHTFWFLLLFLVKTSLCC